MATNGTHFQEKEKTGVFQRITLLSAYARQQIKVPQINR